MVRIHARGPNIWVSGETIDASHSREVLFDQENVLVQIQPCPPKKWRILNMKLNAKDCKNLVINCETQGDYDEFVKYSKNFEIETKSGFDYSEKIIGHW